MVVVLKLFPLKSRGFQQNKRHSGLFRYAVVAKLVFYSYLVEKV